MAQHRTLEDLAYRDIRTAITDGRLVPGQRIVVSALAASAGISRIPLMQALRRLETEGFVRIAPHKEVVVSKPTPAEFRERFVLLAALEALTIREAAAKMTSERIRQLRGLQKEIIAAQRAKDAAVASLVDGRFHGLLWETAELPQTIRILQSLWDRGEYYRMIMHSTQSGFAKASVAEHEEILGALETSDFHQAARASEHHHLQSMARLVECLPDAGAE